MRKARVTGAASLVGGLLIVLVFLFPVLGRVHALGWFYAPAILVSLLVSGTHSPNAASLWLGTIAESGLVVAGLIVVRALLQERRHFLVVDGEMKRARHHLGQKQVPEAFDALGQALVKLNDLRAQTWFLEPLPMATPPTSPAGAVLLAGDEAAAAPHRVFAAAAISTHPKHRLVAKTLEKIERDMMAGGAADAAELTKTLREHAERVHRSGSTGA